MAVSPIIAGKTVKGPADKMLKALDIRCDALGVAHCYQGLIDLLVIDERDAGLAPAIADTGIDTAITDTQMFDRTDKVRLANFLIAQYRQEQQVAL